MARELPHNNEAEQAILGALLVYPDVISIVEDEALHEEDFFSEAHKAIFKTMLELHKEEKPIELKLLVSRLNDNNSLNFVGGVEYLAQLADNAISGASAKYYIDIIRTKADQRNLIKITQLLSEKGFDESNPIDSLLDEAEKQILAVTRERRGITNFRSSEEVADTVVKELENIRHSEQGLTGICTGFSDLDHLTNGLQRGDLIILAARPSVGKTAFALNVALNAAKSDRNEHCSVAVFSLEMPAEQLMRRMLSAESGVKGDKLRSGNINDEEMQKVYSATNVLRNCNIFIDDSSGVKIAEIFSKCRKLKSEHGLDLILIDYLQLISGNSRGGSDNRQQEVSEISRSLKALARELDCPVIALSQLSRSVEQRQDKTPQLSDLRESGSIEQDADIVMFLSRDDYQKTDEEEQQDNVEVNLSVKKHRNGAIADLTIVFEKNINKFFNSAFDKYSGSGVEI